MVMFGGEEKRKKKSLETDNDALDVPSMHGMESVSTIRSEKWESRAPVTSDAFTSVDVYGARNWTVAVRA